MCNVWCKTFVANSLQDWPDKPEVLEVGSRNVNGSPRDLCQPRASRYVGCDLDPGDGVDVIADATRLTTVFPPGSFDVVISTEMLEHVPDWPSAWTELMAVLRPGGLLILSTRSPGFPLHSYPGDFWRFTSDDIRVIMEGFGNILHLDDDYTMGYPCGIGVVARKRNGIDLPTWRKRLASEVPVYNMDACSATTYEAFAAGIPQTGNLIPLRERVRELEQTVFDAQITALGAHNAVNQLAMCEEELLHARARVQMLESSPAVRCGTYAKRLLRSVDPLLSACLLFARVIRCLWSPLLRRRAWNNLSRRCSARLGGRRIKELPDLDWLLGKLGLDVSAEQVTARLGRYMTRDEEVAYRAMVEPLRAAGQGVPSRVVRVSHERGDSSGPNRRRRILFVCGEFPNPVHGGGGRVADFIKALSRNNDVYVAAWYDRKRDYDAFIALAPHCRGLRGLSFEDLEAGCAGKLLRLLDDRPVDVVHYEWPRSLNSFDRRLGRHHIYTHCESVAASRWMDLHRLAVLSPDWLKQLADWMLMIKFEALDTRCADVQIVVTAKDGEFLSRFVTGQTYYIVNHGVTSGEFDLPDRPAEPHTVVFTGNFQHLPNLDAAHYFMRQIRPLILKTIPDLRILWVGANPPKELVRYGNGGSVVVTGKVPDVRPFIQQAAVCIAPLISGAGLRTKVVQYAALRRPCVATSIAVEDLGFENGRDVFIADRPEVFAERVAELLRNPARAAAMAEQAYKRARACYDNRVIAERVLANLYDVLETNQGAP